MAAQVCAVLLEHNEDIEAQGRSKTHKTDHTNHATTDRLELPCPATH